MTRTLTRLARAMDRRAADWLLEMEPEIYHAIDAELADGATVEDVVRVVVDNGSPAFVRVVRGAARWLKGSGK